MKILQLIYESPESPFGFGGAGVRAYEIYRRLCDRHDITLLSMKFPGACSGEYDGIDRVYVGAESKSLFRSVLLYTIRAADFVRKYGNTFDVIVENFLPSTPFFSRFLTRTPVLLQVQGIMEGHSLKKFGLLYSLPMFLVERFYPRLYNKFIFVSDITKEKVLAKAGDGTDSCLVIPNGINDELLGISGAGERYILFMSRIDIYTKGLDLLVKAFEKTALAYPDLRLVLAGYQFDAFDTLASKLSPAMKDKVSYAGFVTGEEKVRLLSHTEVFVLPSRHESSPISILEAAACGKPVLVSDIPELAFVTEEGFGMSFQSGSVVDLAEKLDRLLMDEPLRHRFGQAGKIYARNFSWDAIALQFEDALKGARASAR